METPIRQIGNSKGIVIPSALLKEYNFQGKVSLTPNDEGILLRPLEPRKGWSEDAKRLASENDDQLLLADYFDDEDLQEWTW